MADNIQTSRDEAKEPRLGAVESLEELHSRNYSFRIAAIEYECTPTRLRKRGSRSSSAAVATRHFTGRACLKG